MKPLNARSYRGPVRAVVTDLAGTVIDFGSCAPAGAFVELFARSRVTVTPAQARGPMGLHKRDHIATLAALPEVAAQWEAAHGAPCGEADIDALYATFIPLQVACLADHGDLIPGVVEAVAALREKDIRIAATTGYNREMLETVLACAEKQGFVPDAAVCAEDVAGGRPAPWMNFRAMEQLGVFPPASVVAIGDTIPDIASAVNAGVWAVGVTETGNMLGLSQAECAALNAGEREHLLTEAADQMYAAGAHYVINGFQELPGLVGQINRAMMEGKRP